MLSEFTSWYGDRVAEMLPGLGRAKAHEGPADAVVIDMRAAAGDGHGDIQGESRRESLGTKSLGASRADGARRLSVVVRTRRREKALGEFALDQAGLGRGRAILGARTWPEVAVVVPRGTLLERIVTLPLAAEAGLAAVLGYEMDRYTPFSAEEVHWTAAVVARDREHERIRVRILLVPRLTLAPVVEMLARLGVAPTLVEGAIADGTQRTLPLRPPDEAAARSARRLLIAACVCCLLLGSALAALPFLRQSWEADQVEAQIAALQPAVTQADALRRQLIAQSAGNDVIAAEQLRLGEPLQAISALTQLIPDDTFLTVLTLHERQLGLDGQSASAARLIGLLSADPVIRNAAFAAPVTRTEDGADMFSLKAEVRS